MKAFTITENGTKINHTFRDDGMQIAGDGFGPAMIGYPNCKFTIYRQGFSEPESGIIDREIFATVTVPTVALVDFLDHVKKVLLNNKEQFASDAQVQVNRILSE